MTSPTAVEPSAIEGVWDISCRAWLLGSQVCAQSWDCRSQSISSPGQVRAPMSINLQVTKQNPNGHSSLTINISWINWDKIYLSPCTLANHCPLGPTHYLCDFWLTYLTCLSFCYFCKCEATLGGWAVPMAPARFQNQAGCRTPWESGIPFIYLCRHKCWRSKGLFLCSLGFWLLWILAISSKELHPGPGLDVCLLGLGTGWNTDLAEILCYTSLSSIYTLKSKKFLDLQLALAWMKQN